MLPIIPSASASLGIYLPTVPPTTLTSPENWAPQRSLHSGSMPSHHAPLQVPLRFATPNLPSSSANPPEYVWLPQRQYSLTAHHFTPASPILFNADSGEPGIRLSAALNRRFTHLRDRDDLVFKSSRSPTITMRLEVRGPPHWPEASLIPPDSGQGTPRGVGRCVAWISPHDCHSPPATPRRRVGQDP